jgi:hypothetical protein
VNIEEDFIIPLDRAKIVFRILGIVFFIALMSFVLKLAIENSRGGSLFIEIISAMVLFYLILFLITLLSKLFDKLPGLIISPTGILDNSSSLPAGMISWHNVNKIRILSIRSRGGLFIVKKVLAIELEQDLGSQFYKGGNFSIQIFKRVNYPFSITQIQLSNDILRIGFDELSEIISQYHQKYGRA